MATKNHPLKSELRRLLKSFPDTAFMEILVPDVHGVLRGKRIRAKDFEKYCSEPFPFCGGAVMLNVLGEADEGLPGYDDGDPDAMCELVPGSLAPVPWSGRPMAQALFRMFENDGSPYFIDLRAVVERAVTPLNKMGIRIVMATELEFFLFEKSFEDLARDGYRDLTPISAYNEDYHILQTTKEEAVMRPLRNFLHAAGIPVESTKGEADAGQEELNIRYGEALDCADKPRASTRRGPPIFAWPWRRMRGSPVPPTQVRP